MSDTAHGSEPTSVLEPKLEVAMNNGVQEMAAHVSVGFSETNTRMIVGIGAAVHNVREAAQFDSMVRLMMNAPTLINALRQLVNAARDRDGVDQTVVRAAEQVINEVIRPPQYRAVPGAGANQVQYVRIS